MLKGVALLYFFVTQCHAAIRLDLTDLCGQTVPVPDHKESVVVHIPAHIPAHTTHNAICEVHIPQALANLHQFVIRLVPLDQLRPNETQYDCTWLQLKLNPTSSYQPDIVIYDLCNDIKDQVIINNEYFVVANYTGETMTSREGLQHGYDLIITPFHYLACDYMAESGCIDEDTTMWCYPEYVQDCNVFVQSRCPEGCGICTPPACRDLRDNCVFFATRGYCESKALSAYLMEPECQFACEFCERETNGSCCHYGELAGLEDELKFHTCDQFRCIPDHLVCDDVANCVDGSDEGSWCEWYRTTQSGGSGVRWPVWVVLTGWLVAFGIT